MALVKITKQLLKEVDGKILHMERASADGGHNKVHPAKMPQVILELSELAMTKWFSDAPELRTLIPPAWLVEIKRMAIHVPLGDLRQPRSFYLEGVWRVPMNAKPDYLDPQLTVLLHSMTPETREAVTHYVAKSDEHEKKYRQVRHQVKEFLSAATSLNDAVKRFPNIASYIPQIYLNKMAEKKAKAAAAAGAQPQIDEKLLSVVGAVHQLGS